MTRTNARMPETAAIPEVPRHRLLITGNDGWDERWVTSDHPKVRIPQFQYVIIRCGICGEENSDFGLSARMHAEMAHENHFQSRHVGTKVVWKDSFPGGIDDLIRRPSLRELSVRDDTDVWRSWLAKLRGDCPDEEAARIAGKELGDETVNAVLVEHHPPVETYPGSTERSGLPSIRFVRIPDDE